MFHAGHFLQRVARSRGKPPDSRYCWLRVKRSLIASGRRYRIEPPEPVAAYHNRPGAKRRSIRLASFPVAEIRKRQHLFHDPLTFRVSIDQLDLAREPSLELRAIDIRDPDRHWLQPGCLHLFPVLAHPLRGVGHDDLHVLHVTYW